MRDYTTPLIYLLAIEDSNQRDRAWASFRADPEWARVVAASEAHGPLGVRVRNSMLTPTDYSPMK